MTAEAPAQLLARLGYLQRAWDSSPALIAVVAGTRHLLIYQNVTSAALFGERRLGVPLAEAFPELRGRALTMLDDVLATGEVTEVPTRNVGLRDLAGDEVLLRYVLAPLGETAPYDGVVMTAIDVTAEARAQQAAARAELLGGLGERMSAAGSPDGALHVLTDGLVPAVADVAAVFIVPPSPTGGTSGDSSAPVAITIHEDLLQRAGTPPPSTPRDGPSPWDAALAAGHLVLIDPADPEATRGPDSPTAGWLRASGTRNLAVVPLAVGGELAGAVVLLAAGERSPYTQDDAAFLGDIAARAGTAVAQQRHSAQQRDLTLQVQRSLLPKLPPELPGLSAAARYVAGSNDVEVGGDWWDVHHLGAGRVGVGVGDVSGRGISAAIVMGQARAGMHAAAHADLSPVDVLTVLDAQVSELIHIDDTAPGELPPRFATAAYAVIDPFDDTLRVANAGHPPLLLRHPDGEVHQVAAPPGPPLGIGYGQYEDLVVPFPPGSLLVAYTDGLVESRARHVEDGIAALGDLLAGLSSTASVEDIADELLGLAHGLDDTALVVLRYLPPIGDTVRLDRPIANLAEISDARHFVTEAVTTRLPGSMDAVAVVLSELVSNAMQHAGPPVRLRILVTGDRVLIEVRDSSTLRPHRRVTGPQEERGRGLLIVDALATEWGFRITRDGKSTWAELRHPPTAG